MQQPDEYHTKETVTKKPEVEGRLTPPPRPAGKGGKGRGQGAPSDTGGGRASHQGINKPGTVDFLLGLGI